MSMVRVVWTCDICGFSYNQYPYLEKVHENDDCEGDVRIFAWVPQGWKKFEDGYICNECSTEIDNYVSSIRARFSKGGGELPCG